MVGYSNLIMYHIKLSLSITLVKNEKKN